MAYLKKGRLDDALASLQEAVGLEKDEPMLYFNLGTVLYRKNRLQEAIASFQETTRLRKDYPKAHYNLGVALKKIGRLDDAIVALREAVAQEKDHAEAHCHLGLALQDKGQFEDAVAALRRGHELGAKDPGWSYRSAGWIKQCEHLLDLDRKLAAVLKGDRQPADTGERLSLAALCGTYKHCYVAGRNSMTRPLSMTRRRPPTSLPSTAITPCVMRPWRRTARERTRPH